MSDLARAIAFAGCVTTLGDRCDTHPHAPIGWPCFETEEVLALIREVRAGECEEAASAVAGYWRDHACFKPTCHECAMRKVWERLRARAEQHREPCDE